MISDKQAAIPHYVRKQEPSENFGVAEVDQRVLCSACIGDDFLNAEIARHGEPNVCDYCNKHGVVISIAELADRVETAFASHYRRTSPEPSDLEYGLMKEGIRNWYRDGDPVGQVLCDAAQIDEVPAEDIREVLASRHGDIERAKMGEECAFDEESHYTESEPDDDEYKESWFAFETSIKTETRFFSQAARTTLDSIFDVFADPNLGGQPLVVDAGPNTALENVYRARVFESDEALQLALKRADLHIGPVPTEKARAGRMNAHGISVFYGATSVEAAVGEVRPPVGSRVLVGSFQLMRKVRLLDTKVMGLVYAEGSVFDPRTIVRQAKVKFLRTLQDRIMMPVTPDNEPSEYLVTQVIAEYLADREDLDLDGILYPSVQGCDADNIMLFHRSSRVAEEDDPEVSQIEVDCGQIDDDEEIAYFVTRVVSPPNEQCNEFSYRSRSTDENSPDPREATLTLDVESLRVYLVTAATYDTQEREVIHTRWDPTESHGF